MCKTWALYLVFIILPTTFNDTTPDTGHYNYKNKDIWPSVATTQLTASWLTKLQLFPDTASQIMVFLLWSCNSTQAAAHKPTQAINLFFWVLRFRTNNLYSGQLTDPKSSLQFYILYSTGSAATATCAPACTRICHWLWKSILHICTKVSHAYAMQTESSSLCCPYIADADLCSVV